MSLCKLLGHNWSTKIKEIFNILKGSQIYEFIFFNVEGLWNQRCKGLNNWPECITYWKPNLYYNEHHVSFINQYSQYVFIMSMDILVIWLHNYLDKACNLFWYIEITKYFKNISTKFWWSVASNVFSLARQ
jgi:hypothetical protein